MADMKLTRLYPGGYKVSVDGEDIGRVVRETYATSGRTRLQIWQATTPSGEPVASKRTRNQAAAALQQDWGHETIHRRENK